MAHLKDIAPESIRPLVERIERNLEREAKLNFLDTQLDINWISDSLSAVGITRASVLSPPAHYRPTPLYFYIHPAGVLVCAYITIVVLVDFEQYCRTEKVLRSKIVDWFCELLHQKKILHGEKLQICHGNLHLFVQK